MARSPLPPGFSFHPTDIELVMYYLKRKILGKKVCFDAIAEVNLYQFSPWDLPDKSCLKSKDLEWFFFCPRQKKYASGARTNRGTEKGYWKTTGKDRSVTYKEKTVGMIRTLVFHLGQAPHGKRTDWVMHEYRLLDMDLADTGCVQDSFVLCKIFQKSGSGPKNAAQYGAPFIEEELDEDEDTCAESSLVGGLNPFMLGVGNSSNTKAVESTIVPGNICSLHLIEPGKSTGKAVESTIVPGSTCSLSLIEPGSSAAQTSASDVLPIPDNDDLDILLAMFTDENLPASGNENNEEGDIVNPDEVIQAVLSEDSDIFTGLENLGNLFGLNNGVSYLSGIRKAGDVVDPMLWNEEDAYLELLDLETSLTFPTGATEFEPLPSDFFSTY